VKKNSIWKTAALFLTVALIAGAAFIFGGGAQCGDIMHDAYAYLGKYFFWC